MQAAQSLSTAELNLAGQRLGSKGRQTRERILAATRRLFARDDTPLSLTAIAAETPIALTSLYRYFTDLGDLALAALEPIREEMNEVVAMMEKPWPAENAYAPALAFLHEHYRYWKRNAGALRFRNRMANDDDTRFVKCRLEWAHPLLDALTMQLDTAHGAQYTELHRGAAGMLITAAERSATIETLDVYMPYRGDEGMMNETTLRHQAQVNMEALARMIALMLRHGVHDIGGKEFGTGF